MKTKLILLIGGVLGAAALATPPGDFVSTGQGDHISCLLRFFGTMDEEGGAVRVPMYAPTANLLKLWKSGPTFESIADLGAVRVPVSSESRFKLSRGAASLNVRLAEPGMWAGLRLSYYLAVEEKDGKPSRAAQHVCLSPILASTKKESVYVVPSGCIEPRPLPNPFDGTISSRADALFHWDSTELKDGIPVLKLNRETYVETPSGSGILKIACSNKHDLFPAPPAPVVPYVK